MDPKSYLKNLGINFKLISHPAVFTCVEAEKYKEGLSSPGLKNLFLKTKQKPERYFLVILPANKKLDLKSLEEKLKCRLTFTNEKELNDILGLSQGSVSVFGLLNDLEKLVNLMIDKEVLEEDFVSFHPNINTETLELSKKDFLLFLSSLRVDYTSF